MKMSVEKDPSERFNDRGGYFDLVVRPKLQQGHEGELCGWLKEMSLIRAEASCSKPECTGRSLVWNTARVVDKYNWNCPGCSRKQSIRESSFFLSVKCDFKTCLQIILGWCQMIPNELAASYLGVKEHVIKKVYERCAKVAESYVNSHPEEYVLGGPGTVLIVDEYPSGYMTEYVMNVSVSKKRNNNSQAILCIAEANAKHSRPRMWMHMISGMPIMNKAQGNPTKCGMVEEALNEIMEHVLPGSFIVANNKARCCNYESIKELKHCAVFDIEYLQKFDVPGKDKLLSNLEMIWRTGVKVCEEVQESTNALCQQIISTHLWHQRFGSSPSFAFEQMLNHIAETYKFA